MGRCDEWQVKASIERRWPCDTCEGHAKVPVQQAKDRSGEANGVNARIGRNEAKGVVATSDK
jgi:hypothetical protein